MNQLDISEVRIQAFISELERANDERNACHPQHYTLCASVHQGGVCYSHLMCVECGQEAIIEVFAVDGVLDARVFAVKALEKSTEDSIVSRAIRRAMEVR